MTRQRIRCFGLTLGLSLGLLTSVATAQAIDLSSTFDALDTDDNARITFAEFSSYTESLGLTRTLAAQHFTSMSAGDAVITQQEWFLATQISESQSWTRGYALDPLEDTPTEVGPADIRAFETVPAEPQNRPIPVPLDPPTEEEAG